jgi:hypothetical protein
VPVPRGAIGFVDCFRPPWLPPSSSVSSVTVCSLPVWLETMITTGPAPNSFGEIEISLSEIAAVMLIGEAGRGAFL